MSSKLSVENSSHSSGHILRLLSGWESFAIVPIRAGHPDPEVLGGVFYSGCIILVHPAVLSVLGVGSSSKIVPSVVFPVSVDVVYSLRWPLTGHVQPRESVSNYCNPEYFNPPISERVDPPSLTAHRGTITPCPHGPSEHPSIWAVVQEFFELFLRYIWIIGLHNHTAPLAKLKAKCSTGAHL